MQTITSLKLKLFYFVIYCCRHHERKTTRLDIFLLSDRQWGTEHQYLLSRFLGVSILQLLTQQAQQRWINVEIWLLRWTTKIQRYNFYVEFATLNLRWYYVVETTLQTATLFQRWTSNLNSQFKLQRRWNIIWNSWVRPL
jgi:hypothetical protein